MFDDMIFQSNHVSEQFQMIMRTKWLLEHIAAQAMRRQGIKLAETTVAEGRSRSKDFSSFLFIYHCHRNISTTNNDDDCE